MSRTRHARTKLPARPRKLKGLYAWGDLPREQYQAERDRAERAREALRPVERSSDHPEALATDVQSLPLAWADADQRQRNQMATILDIEMWVDGPRVEYVEPRPELEPLVQTRTGAAQPTKVSIQGADFSSGDPDGERGRMTQQWDFPVDEPVSLQVWRVHRTTAQLPAIAERIAAGEALRALAAEEGISHEALRQVLKRAGYATRKAVALAAAPRRSRGYRVVGRGRSRIFDPGEVTTLLARHRAGESIRSLARASGVSHETIRRILAEARCNPAHAAIA